MPSSLWPGVPKSSGLLPTVKDAMRELKPDATGIYVAANQAAAAIEEAIEAEVPLIVAVAEHIPVHDKTCLRFAAAVCPIHTYSLKHFQENLGSKTDAI
ncbi:hypothetical protein FB45DRAFT_1029335 [Roridomyces roridus]|uniref:CoA-binding domain-containing protein n=1 Tax=Roridomyces roridus TaxID=1738132 RepID=A0AAD7BPF5_9AGAR|nr:hypothetical protein FB45DRAFT_1029335 [Roridomyces roridus]